jgi:broad specificity phosphatase PhoE
MTTTVWFEMHATSCDNEAGIASGHFDADLAPVGEVQALELGRRYARTALDTVITSDLRRAWRTAAIAFGDRVRVRRDARLRECDYGELTRAPVALLEARRPEATVRPFPGGESYEQVVERVRPVLQEIARAPGRSVLVIGHRATFYVLEHLLKGVPLADIVTAPWSWQPGWRYEL